jgi:hypothetical protein
LEEVLAAAAPVAWEKDAIIWPPDAFGLAALILHVTGSYLRAINDWPPGQDRLGWTRRMRALGQEWRDLCVKYKRDRNTIVFGSAPPQIKKIWKTITSNASLPVSALRTPDVFDPNTPSGKVVQALLEILAAADEACLGIGIPGDDVATDKFLSMAGILLYGKENESSSLCYRIPSSSFSVLPKLHTPQNGMTIRSLTHHLALIPGGESKISWYWGELAHESSETRRHGMNVLLAPWPQETYPSCFRPFKTGDDALRNLPKDQGFFDYKNKLPDGAVESFKKLYFEAKNFVGEVDLVVFPELSLDQKTLDLVAEFLIAQDMPPTVIAGVSLPAESGSIFPLNACVTLSVHRQEKSYGRTTQSKHHRWRLDSRQIRQYGLGGQLDPQKYWWEASRLTRRELCFYSLGAWLTFCSIICEDLARPDPVADILRAVGPNVVIALLMDGPQLEKRWPARYASVLADDPGSSVLTVTNLGMVLRSVPPGQKPSRVVALWKDAIHGSQEIDLPAGCDGVALCITRHKSREYTADGRDDSESTMHLVLSGVHFLNSQNIDTPGTKK